LWHSRKLNCQSKLYVSFPGCPPGFEISISYAKKVPLAVVFNENPASAFPRGHAVQPTMSFAASIS
jgi:hypothetical protein